MIKFIKLWCLNIMKRAVQQYTVVTEHGTAAKLFIWADVMALQWVWKSRSSNGSISRAGWKDVVNENTIFCHFNLAPGKAMYSGSNNCLTLLTSERVKQLKQKSDWNPQWKRGIEKVRNEVGDTFFCSRLQFLPWDFPKRHEPATERVTIWSATRGQGTQSA